MIQIKALENYPNLEPILISLTFLFIYLSTFNTSPHFDDYDVVRDLIVSQEVQIRGIQTYFDSAYWQHPPLLNYSIALVGSLFGINIFLAGEFVILLFSFLSIFIFYKLCIELKDRNFARIATFVFGVTPMIWMESIQVMHEIPMTFLFIATLYYFLLATKYDKSKYFYISGAFLGLSLLTKSQTIIAIPIMLAYILSERRKAILGEKHAIKNIVIMFLIAGAIYSPYLLYRSVNGAPSFFGERAFTEILTGKADWAPTGDISVPADYYITHIFDIISFSTIFFAIGLYYTYLKKDKTMYLPLIWVALSYLILSIFSHKGARYMITAVPAMVIISVYGIYAITEKIKGRKIFYMASMALIAALLVNSIYSNTTSQIHWPTNWGMWDDLKSLNNSVLSTDLNKYSKVSMPYGVIKLMTGKFSDILPEDPKAGVSFAMMYNTPYLLYDGRPELAYPHIKMKYFEECNCTLYKIDEKLLFENKTLIKMVSDGKPLEGATLYLVDSGGNIIYRSRSNLNGEIYLPTENYTGLAVASKICYESIQTYIKIDNGKLSLCGLKQRQSAIGLSENYLECKAAESINMNSIGCFEHKYPMSRF